jgi:predicted O-methyltransferase YrrM
MHAASELPAGFWSLLAYSVAFLQLESKTLKCRSLEDYIMVPYTFTPLLAVLEKTGLLPFPIPTIQLRILQDRQEFTEFIRVVSDLRPRAICEIGTAWGGTLYVFSRICSPDAIMASIDKEYQVDIRFLQRLAQRSQRLHLLEADSHSPRTFERLARIFSDTPLDLLFIDGDHSYEGVRNDFLTYGSLVRQGGIIAFHDVLHHSDPNIGVERFWSELKESHPTKEIIHDAEKGWGGIGLLFK